MHEPPAATADMAVLLHEREAGRAQVLRPRGVALCSADRYCKTPAVGLSCYSSADQGNQSLFHQWRQYCSRSSRKEMCTLLSQGERETFSLSGGSSPSWPNRSSSPATSRCR